MNILFVFIGGGVGSLLRYGVSLAVAPYAFRFPWATFISNTVACLIIGFVAGLSLKGSLDSSARLFLATGICGGFSTFSSFSNETLRLFQEGQPWAALANILFSVSACLLCVYGGMKISGLTV